jgi:hypothetical protein
VIFSGCRVAGAAVAKLAYAVGLKSTGVFPVVGSSPTSRTISKRFILAPYLQMVHSLYLADDAKPRLGVRLKSRTPSDHSCLPIDVSTRASERLRE